jgi:hypothetical protein
VLTRIEANISVDAAPNSLTEGFEYIEPVDYFGDAEVADKFPNGRDPSLRRKASTLGEAECHTHSSESGLSTLRNIFSSIMSVEISYDQSSSHF